jgi:hypothetical protein
MADYVNFLVTITRTLTFSTTVAAASYEKAVEAAQSFDLNERASYEDSALISKSEPIVKVMAAEYKGQWIPYHSFNLRRTLDATQEGEDE